MIPHLLDSLRLTPPLPLPSIHKEGELLSSLRQYSSLLIPLHAPLPQEMDLLNEVEKPGSNIDTYVSSLDRLLEEKLAIITSLREKLSRFQAELKKEDALAKSFKTSVLHPHSPVAPLPFACSVTTSAFSVCFCRGQQQ